MNKHLFYLILSCLPILGFGQILQEGFDDITTLGGAGWTMTNQSSPIGTTEWFQGNATVFTGHQGGATSYIGANFNNTAGTGTISNWLITPTLNLKDGDVLSFYTRTSTASTWNDRLEVRSSVGTMTLPVGVAAVGSFTNLHLTVNPDLNLSYPEVWTQYEVTVSGVGSTPVAMNFAFRYTVPNGGPSGSNSNFIGIDTLLVEEGGGGGPVEYCEVTYTSNIEPITHVIFAGIDNESNPVLNGSPAMEDFTSISGDVTVGESYEIALEGNTDGNFRNTFTVFIDWNQNGVLNDAGEMYEAGTIMNSTGTDGQQALTDIAVPADAMEGSTRMRIIKDWTSSTTPVWPSDPCGTYDFGQTEDYTLNVTTGGGGPGEDCSQSTPSNAFENGHGFLQSAHIAHDFSVDADVVFTVEQFTFNILTVTTTATVTLSFYEDAGGQPGTLLYTTPAIVPTSITNIGTAFGFNVESTVVDLPVPQEFQGGASGANYFVAATISNPGNSYWESTTIMNTPHTGYWSPDGGVTWTALTDGPWDGVFEIAGTCEDGGSTGEGCEWTVTVSDTGWGDEVSWELRDAGGVVVMSGGPYTESGGYTDTQTAMAEGPVEFFIETIGTFNDNT
ncbi:MAG: choice-of-anchor J domain-containing protein, partial [Moheibacter sp.]